MNFLSLLSKKAMFIAIAALIAVTLIAGTLSFPLDLFGLYQNEAGSKSYINPTQLQKKKLMAHNYDESWLEIDSLENEGLYQSALKKTEELLLVAKAENNTAQTIKCLMYSGKYLSQLEEDGFPKAINKLEEEMQLSSAAAKPIFQSMLAELYDNYASDNYWSLSNRTETVNFKNEDINTWTLGQLTDRSFELYTASLHAPQLKSIPIGEFSILLTEGENVEGLRPTLFDFLAHRAIDYFMDEKSYLAQPAYKFYINDEKAFAPAAEFISWTPETKDSTSFKLKAIQLFQELLAFRTSARASNPGAFLDAELKRLRFVFDNSVSSNKQDLYLKALEKLRSDWSGKEVESEILYQLAAFYYSEGSEFEPVPFGMNLPEAANKWHFKKAFDLCMEAVNKYPNSFGAKLCQALLIELQSKSLSIKTELVNLPGKPFPGRIEYRNVEKAWFKVIRLEESNVKEYEKLRAKDNSDELVHHYFNTLKSLEEWSVALPNDGDYRAHSAEFAINKLPIGHYLLMVSDAADFSRGESAVSYLFTTVSNLGFWERRDEKRGMEFVVFDRESGAPLKGVTAEFYTRNYNSVFRKYDLKLAARKTSDADGFVRPELSKNESRSFQVVFKKGNDRLSTDETYYDYTRDGKFQPYQQTNFFLDRAIYRPGQTVYFKGIALQFDEERMPKIIKNQSVTVTFTDANWQEVSKVKLRTNEYGTFNGTFTAPQGGLLGEMRIQSDLGGQSKSFRVEEYKRPKFEVSFEPIKGTYKLDEKVTVTGKAEAYAGSNVDGANVVWRVVREVSFPWMPWWQRSWMPWRSETMEIANGTATTGMDGNFTIEFKALPDRSIPKDQKPEFAFKVIADVTDITGETQSTETTVKAGYIALLADIGIGNEINADSLSIVKLTTTNLNGQFEGTKGIIQLELLSAPKALLVNRLWEKPDRQILSEADFKKTFPQFAWAQEDLPENWKTERLMWREEFDTEKSGAITISNPKDKKSRLKTGWYALRLLTKDKFGEEVSVNKFFQVYNPNEKSIAGKAIAWHTQERPAYEPGEYATMFFGTSEKKLHVLLEIEKDGNPVSRQWLKICGLQSYKHLIKESDRGNLSYTFSFAMNNRSQNQNATILVPWSNKELAIEYGTFRDKLLPGQEEQWVIKIKGPKGEKVAAEMVAGMYDASLDAFASNNWGLNIFPTSWRRIQYTTGSEKPTTGQALSYFPSISFAGVSRNYSQLNWFNWYMGGQIVYARSMAAMSAAPRGEEMMVAEIAVPRSDIPPPPPPDAADKEGGLEEMPPSKTMDHGPVKVRENLNETVFFYPNLMTDAEGNVLIKFTMNEALTRWKFLGLAHTTDLKIGTTMKEIVTQKDLMVMPNPPRFFRENDEIEFTAKVVNLSDKRLSGNAQLQLVNPMETMPVYKWEDNPQFNQNFTVEPKQSARLAWRFKVPDVSEVPLIEHTVVAFAGDYSDAERNVAPVLSNRMLVTETLPLPVRGNETKNFVFNSLKNNSSTTLANKSFTLEFTQNPAWYAVQALPYLMEYPYDCTEQIFARYYANSLASSVANSHPTIKKVFDKWRNYQPDALMSNLSKNQELKSALLEETPWVLNAQSEEQQKKNIALLFDLNKMSHEQETALAKLSERQMPGGGWAWFPGGRDNRYITQYITEGFGHMHKLGVTDVQKNATTWRMVKDAVLYCDVRMVEDYEQLERLVKEGKAKWADDHLSYMAAHYLYTRSFFLEDKSALASTGSVKPEKAQEYIPLSGKAIAAHKYYLEQAKKYWLKKGQYTEGMLALALNRNAEAASANTIVRSLKERALRSDELGMYWKYPRGYWWYTAPIETHSIMIEVFNEVTNDKKSVDDLKVWLLKNKQTNHWKTTKATALAVYSLLMTGENWLLDSQPLEITIGKGSPEAADWKAGIKQAQAMAEAGTGYFKKTFDGFDVNKRMADISVTNPNNVVSWGAAYWQYFEQLDKITTFEETPLTLKKQLFRVSNSPTGEVMQPIAEGAPLKVGEKLHVRIELRVDRDMEYVHMKDMRASGFEPLNVLSSYKWQGGLGYYESTKDASTNFFISWLPKGTYVFEYPLRVVHKGNFSNGVTTIQCMYAPEFSSHSEGIRVKVD